MRPNLLVIMSDQHNPHVTGYAGDVFVRTPNLDRFADRGVVCSQTYCAGPLCVPSRMTFMTSQHPHDISIWTNGGVLSSDVPTFAHSLSLAGYETVLCGRMHFVGPDQHHGFDRRIVGDVSGAMKPQPTGLFEGVWSRAGCGQSFGSLLDDAVGSGQATYAAYDDAVTAGACQFLRAARSAQSERPFCLVVGMLLPHNPYVCPKELFEEYMDKLPDPNLELPGGEHPAVQQLKRTRGTDQITRADARRARAAYYGLVTCMDRNIGQIMEALEETELADNTVVAYTSDHGDLNGEHGLWWKDSFYEGSVCVPMLWSWPQGFRKGESVSAVTSLLDVGPTLIELGQAEPLPGQRGHSLLPLLTPDGAASAWPDAAFAETFANQQRPARMLRTGRWKMNVYHGYERPQLFDLASDPEETRDLGAEDDYADVRRELMAQLTADGWAGADVQRRQAQQSAELAMVRRWRQAWTPCETERWQMPARCNIRE